MYLYRRVRLHLRRGFPGLFRGREGFGRMRPVYQEEGLTTPGRIKGRNIWSSGKEKKTGTSECLDFSKQQTSRNGITPGSERHLLGQVLYFYHSSLVNHQLASCTPSAVCRLSPDMHTAWAVPYAFLTALSGQPATTARLHIP